MALAQADRHLYYQIPNPSVAALYEDALVSSRTARPVDARTGCSQAPQVYETGTAITSSGALTAYSGKKTGRSPLDKRIVKEPTSENDIWYGLLVLLFFGLFLFFFHTDGAVPNRWGPVNKPMTPEVRS